MIEVSTIFHELAHFNDIVGANDLGGYTIASCLKKASEGLGHTNATNWDLMSIEKSWKKMTWDDVINGQKPATTAGSLGARDTNAKSAAKRDTNAAPSANDTTAKPPATTAEFFWSFISA